MRLAKINSMEVIAGLAVMAIGAFGLVTALRYDFGTVQRMGPGFLPVVHSAMMILAGLGIMLVEGTDPNAQAMERPNWRALVSVIGAICVFAFLIDRFGLVPASIAAILVSATAESRYNIPVLLAFAVLISLTATVIFVWGLGLPVEPLKW